MCACVCGTPLYMRAREQTENQQGAEESVDWGVGVLGQRRRPHTPPTLCVNVPAASTFLFSFYMMHG